MTKILVTGATGRLGGQVVEFLLRRVTGVTNNQTSAFHPCRRFASEFSIAGVGPKAALRHCAEINYATNEGPPYGGASPL